MFQYHVENNLFSSIGKINIIDIKKNNYFFKELHVDTKKKEMIGSDVRELLDPVSYKHLRAHETRGNRVWRIQS